jgi:DNA-binding response OmpR family regulator
MVRKILSVCYEECLPPSTLEFLQYSGCDMTCARSPGAAFQLLNTLRFDLVLINQTVSGPQEHLFVKLIREKSNIPILFVGGSVNEQPPGVSAWLKPPVTPQEILRIICELVPG